MFGRCAIFILDHQVFTWLVLVCLTVVGSVGNFYPTLVTDWFRIAKSAEPFRPTISDDDVKRPPNVKPFTYSDGNVIVVVESDDIFTPTGARLIREVLKSINELPFVTKVTWMEDSPPLNIFGLAETVLPRGNASQARFDIAKQRAVSNPLIGGQLLSGDGTVLLLMLNIDWFFVDREGQATEQISVMANQIAEKYPEVQFKFSTTGSSPIHLLAAQAHESNETKYQLIGYGVILLMAVVLFRGIAAVVIVALAPILGVFWTLGILHFFDIHDNPFNSAVLPVLLSLVGFTDGVHMMVQIRRQRAAGLSPQQAARRGLNDVGFACFLTSFTTAIGFGSLATAHHEIVREFGWSCVIGVTLTLVSGLTVIPLLCSTWLGRWVASGYGNNLVDRNLEKIAGVVKFVVARKKFFAWTAITVTFCMLCLCALLRPDERQTSMLPDDAEAVKALRTIDRSFGGMDFSTVCVRWNKQIPDNAPELGAVMQQVDALLRSEPLIAHPLSIYNLIQALPGSGPVEQRMSLLELMPPPLKRAFYTPEYRFAESQFRVQDLGIAKYNDTFRRIDEGLVKIANEHPNFSLSLEGNAVARCKNLFRIVLDLCYSLGTAGLIIFAVLAVVYRSMRIGLISVVPNLFPLAATGVLLLVTGQYLELVSVCAFTVCLGIAVDDTIHFLTRYREELGRNGGQVEPAINSAFVGVGTGLIITTVVLVVGFATALTSDARDTRIFVTMSMLTITGALFADLIFLPAMLAYFQPSKSFSTVSKN